MPESQLEKNRQTAAYPFLRNHNLRKPQAPRSWGYEPSLLSLPSFHPRVSSAPVQAHYCRNGVGQSPKARSVQILGSTSEEKGQPLPARACFLFASLRIKLIGFISTRKAKVVSRRR